MMSMKLAWVWTWRKLDLSLNVSDAVANTFFRYTQAANDDERGGQLFVDLNHSDGLWLVEASIPHSTDNAGPNWLLLNPDRCLNEIRMANEKGLRLIGYWHTHPEDNAKISMIDVRSFKEFSKRNAEILKNPLIVIVGRESVNAWIIIEGSIEVAEKIFISSVGEQRE